MSKKELKHSLEDVKIVARLDWVLVKPIAKKDKLSDSGLSTPDSEESEQKAVGTVVNFGCEVSGISEGDRILYGVYSGESVEVTEKGKVVEYKLMMDEDIIAFIR